MFQRQRTIIWKYWLDMYRHVYATMNTTSVYLFIQNVTKTIRSYLVMLFWCIEAWWHTPRIWQIVIYGLFESITATIMMDFYIQSMRTKIEVYDISMG